jgi:hypothetical protein
MIATSLLGYLVFRFPVEHNFQLVVYGWLIAGIVWSILRTKQSNPGEASFKVLFQTGFRVFMIVSLCMAVFTGVYFSQQPEFRDQKIIENTELLKQAGNQTPTEIAQNEERLRDIFLPMMISGAIFRYLIVGALVSVVAAGFLQRKSTTP